MHVTANVRQKRKQSHKKAIAQKHLQHDCDVQVLTFAKRLAAPEGWKFRNQGLATQT